MASAIAATAVLTACSGGSQSKLDETCGYRMWLHDAFLYQKWEESYDEFEGPSVWYIGWEGSEGPFDIAEDPILLLEDKLQAEMWNACTNEQMGCETSANGLASREVIIPSPADRGRIDDDRRLFDLCPDR
jgi:hypothetical protein